MSIRCRCESSQSCTEDLSADHTIFDRYRQSRFTRCCPFPSTVTKRSRSTAKIDEGYSPRIREIKNSMKRPVKWFAISALLVPMIALAASWWNNDWKYRKEITFDLSPAGAAIAGTPQAVPGL